MRSRCQHGDIRVGWYEWWDKGNAYRPCKNWSMPNPFGMDLCVHHLKVIVSLIELCKCGKYRTVKSCCEHCNRVRKKICHCCKLEVDERRFGICSQCNGQFAFDVIAGKWIKNVPNLNRFSLLDYPLVLSEEYATLLTEHWPHDKTGQWNKRNLAKHFRFFVSKASYDQVRVLISALLLASTVTKMSIRKSSS